jgi:hypothetical protein
VRRRQALARGVEQEAREGAADPTPLAFPCRRSGRGEALLDALPQLRVHDCGVLAGMNRPLVDHLAAVDPVAQQVEQGAAPERPARLADHSLRPQPLVEQADGAERR